jgi:hypothetical protein
MFAASKGDWDAVNRYVEDALVAEQQFGKAMPEVHLAEGFAALNQGRLDDYQRIQRVRIAAFRAQGEEQAVASALMASAMAKALRGEDLDAAVAEVDEALSRAERVAVPSVRVTLEGFGAFVLADVQPERARGLMESAIRRWTLIPGIRTPVHSVLGDVAERLGDHPLALEYFVLGMDEHYWLGSIELVGRMLRRIGLALAESEPTDAARIIGAGMERSQAGTLTERVNRHHRERVALIEAAIGADRCGSLLRQGATLTDHEAVALAHEAAERALPTAAPTSDPLR